MLSRPEWILSEAEEARIIVRTDAARFVFEIESEVWVSGELDSRIHFDRICVFG